VKHRIPFRGVARGAGNRRERRRRAPRPQSLRALAALAVASAFAGSPAAADTVNLEPSRDTTIYQVLEVGSTQLSNGSGDHIFAGPSNEGRTRRALLSFDVAATIPAGSTITSATLHLHLSRSLFNTTAVSVHRLLADWGEGDSDAAGEEGGGTAAEPGDATWFYRFFDSALWTAAGGDFDATASASATVGSTTGSYAWTSAQLAADVQAFLDGPATNFGWILVGNDAVAGTAKRFDSRTHDVVDQRPRLEIVYAPGPTRTPTATPTVTPSPTPTPTPTATGTPPTSAPLDLDADGEAAALTDGLLLVRYLFGLRGASLVNGVVDVDCTRCDAPAIEAWIAAMAAHFDLDGDGTRAALSDGVLALRYLFGLRDAALVSGAVAAGCQRCTADEIEAHVAGIVP
jgi:hypothetical protein